MIFWLLERPSQWPSKKARQIYVYGWPITMPLRLIAAFLLRLVLFFLSIGAAFKEHFEDTIEGTQEWDIRYHAENPYDKDEG